MGWSLVTPLIVIGRMRGKVACGIMLPEWSLRISACAARGKESWFLMRRKRFSDNTHADAPVSKCAVKGKSATRRSRKSFGGLMFFMSAVLAFPRAEREGSRAEERREVSNVRSRKREFSIAERKRRGEVFVFGAVRVCCIILRFRRRLGI